MPGALVGPLVHTPGKTSLSRSSSSSFNVVFYSLAFLHSLKVKRPFTRNLKTELAWPVKSHVATQGKCLSWSP